LPDKVITTEQLTKYYGRVLGVSALDMDVYEGEVFGFLGPNGAGKTTTIRLLMGLMHPSSGRASVFGMDAWKESVGVKKKIGYLPGDAALYERMTGEAHLRFVSSFYGGEGAMDEGLALAKRLELELDRKVSGFSKGMRQKLAIVLALMKKPPLLIMDEPTNALDPITQRVLYDILSERRGEGTTILFSSHNLPEVERIADRVGILRRGTLAGTERIEDLRGLRLRNVEIIFDGEIPEDLGLDEIEGVSGVERLGSRLTLKLRGDINPLLRLMARYDVADFSVSHASLEDVFLDFYKLEPVGTDTTAATDHGADGGEDS
jgi:ABC-2 type transport system ATP-binding protein